MEEKYIFRDKHLQILDEIGKITGCKDRGETLRVSMCFYHYITTNSKDNLVIIQDRNGKKRTLDISLFTKK